MKQSLLNGGTKPEKDNWIKWQLSTRADGTVEVISAVKNGVELTLTQIREIYPNAWSHKEHDIHIVG